MHSNTHPGQSAPSIRKEYTLLPPQLDSAIYYLMVSENLGSRDPVDVNSKSAMYGPRFESEPLQLVASRGAGDGWPNTSVDVELIGGGTVMTSQRGRTGPSTKGRGRGCRRGTPDLLLRLLVL